MKKNIYAVLLCFLIQQTGFAQSANWSAVLPNLFPTNASGQINGISRVSQMKFHPTNSSKLYAVSARGGLFISTDAGTTWTVTPGTDFMSSSRFASVCVDFTNDQILYLGEGDHDYYYTGNGVLKSTNGGQTFSQTTLTNKLVVDMIMQPTDHNVIVAATDAGIYKTTDAGATWTLKTSAIAFDDLKQKSPNSNILYATSTGSEFYVSYNFGNTWTQITSGIVLPGGVTSGNGCRVAVTPADTNVVYLGMTANGGLLYKSTNGGTSFSAIKTAASPYLTYYDNVITSSGQGDYNFGLGVDRSNASTVYWVSHNVWKSTDGGVNWTQLTNWYAKVHTDMHQITTSPYDNTKLYDMNDGGVWLSTDGGNNWAPKSDGIAGYEIYHGNCSPTRKDMFSIGTQDNGELYATASGWFTNRGGDWSSQCAFDYRSNSSMVYYYENNMRRLVTGSDATYGLPARVTYLEDIAFNRSNTSLAFASDTMIYRTTNLTVTTPTWTQIANFGKKVMAVHSSMADANRLYVITSDGLIYVSTNALAVTPTFTSYSLPSGTNNAASITSIKTNSSVIYVTANTKAYRSADNGVTWTNVTYNLPAVNHVRILSDEYFSSNELVFVASNNTVYYKVASASTWSIYNTNLPSRTSVIDLSIFNDGTANTALRVATYGRGMWETPISNLRALTANFAADNTNPCTGATVQFSDLSTGSVTGRTWTFTGGTPSTSTAANPTVVYSSPGTYNVSLTVTDGTGNSSVTKTAYISTYGNNLPLAEGFEGATDPPVGWMNIDNGTAGALWAKTSAAGGFGNSVNSMMFDNYNWDVTGQKDELQTMRLDLTGYATAKLKFDVAYQAYTGYNDSLAVLLSTDCGTTFNRIYAKGGTGLATAGTGTTEFVPTAGQWRTDSVILNTYVGQPGVILKFQNIGAFGNKIYLDNVNVSATVSASAGTDKAICSIDSVLIGMAAVSGVNYSWTPTTGLSSASISNPYAHPATTTTYILTATQASSGILARDTVVVNVTTATNYYLDADGDGHYTAGPVAACSSPGAGYVTSVTGSGDCAPADNTKWQSATLYIDADNDNYDNGTSVVCYGASIPSGYKASTLGSDCNDADATKHATFSFYADTDNDGVGAGSLVSVCAVNGSTPPTGYSLTGTDCAATDNTKWQSATLYIDADNDNYDNGTSVVCYGASIPTGYKASTLGADCNDADATKHASFSFYADTDNDGVGAGSLVSVCAVNGSTPPTGYSLTGTDCAPSDNTKWRSATFYIDYDNDGYDAGTAVVCYGTNTPTGYKTSTLGTDCKDSLATAHPGAAEICGNGIDDNCNGQTDEACISITGTVTNTLCTGTANGSVVVTVGNGTAPYHYLWSNGATTKDILAVAAAVYSVTVTDTTFSTATASFTVGTTVPAAKPATPGTIAGPTTVCPDTAFIYNYSIVAVANALSYTWTVPANAILVSGQGTTIISVRFTSAYTTGAVTVTATNCIGTSAAKSLTVAKQAKPATPGVITGTVPVCIGNTYSYSIAAVANATSYTWTPAANSTIVSGQGTTSVTVSFQTGYVTSLLSVTASNCGGTSAAKTLSVTKAAVPLTPGAITGSLAVCPSVNYTYSIAAVANATSYIWTVPATATLVSGQGTTSIQVSYPVGYASSALTVVAFNCGGNSAAKSITVASASVAPATPGVITGAVAVCPGTYSYSIATVVNALTYNWVAPANASITAGQGSTTVSVTFVSGFSTGNLTVSASNCKGTSALKTLALKTVPAAPAAITGPISDICATTTGIVYSVAPILGASSYNWIVTGGTITAGQGTTSITVNFPATFTSATVKVQEVTACSSTGAFKSVVVTQKGAIPGTITGTTPVCPTMTYTYFVAPVLHALSYTWTVPTDWTISSGQGTDTITVIAGTLAGKVTVATTNACGTGTAATKNITIGTTCRLGNAGTTAIGEEPTESKVQMKVYPNPADGNEVNIELRGINDAAEITVFDYVGQKVMAAQSIADGVTTLNIAALSAGIYTVELHHKNERKTERLVIQK